MFDLKRLKKELCWSYRERLYIAEVFKGIKK